MPGAISARDIMVNKMGKGSPKEASGLEGKIAIKIIIINQNFFVGFIEIYLIYSVKGLSKWP